jgi:pyridoxine 5-phosphate synthase
VRSTAKPIATALSVNVNKVALLRNSRPLGIPSVILAARRCLEAGAHGITIHPRPDERHIRRTDVADLAAFLKAEYSTIELNIEGNPLEPGFIELVEGVRAAQCTMVPDSRDQSTSDHGWDLKTDGEKLRPMIARLESQGIRVSLFVDPDEKQMPLARELGASRVELYTEPFAREFEAGRGSRVGELYQRAAAAAVQVGLQVNAGHDLNLHNLTPFLQWVPQVLEVSIGHALIADALEYGYAETVKRYLAAIAATKD